MFNFPQFCELATNNQKNSWFYFPVDYMNYLSEAELTLVRVETTNDPTLLRLWYPRIKFYTRPIDADEMKRLLQQALERDDMEEVMRLKNR